MKLLGRILSVLVFFASFVAALYLGYRLFRRGLDDPGYLFGDSLYQEEDGEDLYQTTGTAPTALKEELEPYPPMDNYEGLGHLVH
ncbi:MAG: hypothetical protein A2600_01160 [Candidatus Lambdaproteobacteria bacterium RIFOXYD1_FULL_56_27]|uniref:Uncharacterized protein n=1 Tax=Candidatus Lambdaproteobacteria bacterium RIFOXYD2_FULL_56_26 TaxID=1817773 RepID=A0A1F6GSA4_9PROT|nr:MAG: hypothetical protein A2557_00275 [Candidatus Lambdaproteobacteria bacterium RIFOXYD2_FULL_56_26]OGH01345.1 MAG: hypothetical protein A2426_13110 [Candidatus Lambdaproteobacteria bacterium RIFOXYC1_FULL_56_13]OGH06886.1 MAG: hypothetical protein A2600_01160 [Candidatus Lambdaproteobacteria bacterium RIFOXYD1_FULL_56_27]